MTYYEKRRRSTNFSQLDVANYLGMSYKRYKLIEKGDVKMPSRLINKFNELLHKGDNIHTLDKIEKKIEVDKWWEEMSKPGENGKYKLVDVKNLK